VEVKPPLSDDASSPSLLSFCAWFSSSGDGEGCGGICGNMMEYIVEDEIIKPKYRSISGEFDCDATTAAKNMKFF
jgi:hypothetical protein